MRKETTIRKEEITIEEDMYMIDWEELKIIHEMCSMSLIRYAHHSDAFLKLKEEVSEFIYYRR